MQRFKRIIMPMQGHNKNDLHWLYNTRTELEPPLVFGHGRLSFWFSGTGWRSREKLLLHVGIPADLSGYDAATESVPVETYLLRLISPMLAGLGESYLNTNKNIREKAQFEAQVPGGRMIRRNGIRYDGSANQYVLRINFNVPLVNALSVNAKSAVRAVKDILEHIEAALLGYDREELGLYVRTYRCQQEIRRYMREHGLCAFVADGSILPRENGTDEPMKGAVPFRSPGECSVAIPLSDGTKMPGMGVRRGVTVITGGGYSGKSTLLDAIEMGIYDHIPGDGREYVLTDDSALKIYAEDGRPVSGLDLSPFFKFLPGGAPLREFSTPHASGSVSQAANIIEAVCGGCRLLLIDEDKSATNFMIRDRNMRLLVKDEPIIPFTDRVRELSGEKGVSTILVIGGSSEYLACADTVLLMEGYLPRTVTEEVRGLPGLSGPPRAETPADWTAARRLEPLETAAAQPFMYFRSVETENEKKIILDGYSADITFLTALVSGGQLNTLACVMERLLTDGEAGDAPLLDKAGEYTELALGKMQAEDGSLSLLPETARRFNEGIRPIDVFCCANRMRGLRFQAEEVKA